MERDVPVQPVPAEDIAPGAGRVRDDDVDGSAFAQRRPDLPEDGVRVADVLEHLREEDRAVASGGELRLLDRRRDDLEALSPRRLGGTRVRLEPGDVEAPAPERDERFPGVRPTSSTGPSRTMSVRGRLPLTRCQARPRGLVAGTRPSSPRYRLSYSDSRSSGGSSVTPRPHTGHQPMWTVCESPIRLSLYAVSSRTSGPQPRGQFTGRRTAGRRAAAPIRAAWSEAWRDSRQTRPDRRRRGARGRCVSTAAGSARLSGDSPSLRYRP